MLKPFELEIQLAIEKQNATAWWLTQIRALKRICRIYCEKKAGSLIEQLVHHGQRLYFDGAAKVVGVELEHFTNKLAPLVAAHFYTA